MAFSRNDFKILYLTVIFQKMTANSCSWLVNISNWHLCCYTDDGVEMVRIGVTSTLALWNAELFFCRQIFSKCLHFTLA